MRYFLERMKKFSGIEDTITEADLPKINPLKLGELRKNLIKRVNEIPPYYVMYHGKNKSIVTKSRF